MQEWRNWQTRRLQVPVVAISCGFKSRFLHSFYARNAVGSTATDPWQKRAERGEGQRGRPRFFCKNVKKGSIDERNIWHRNLLKTRPACGKIGRSLRARNRAAQQRRKCRAEAVPAAEFRTAARRILVSADYERHRKDTERI